MLAPELLRRAPPVERKARRAPADQPAPERHAVGTPGRILPVGQDEEEIPAHDVVNRAGPVVTAAPPREAGACGPAPRCRWLETGGRRTSRLVGQELSTLSMDRRSPSLVNGLGTTSRKPRSR